MVLDGIFTALFGPILSLPNPFGLLLISTILTGLITLIYKYASDQAAMKALKEEIKAIQQDVKRLKDQPDKVLEKNKLAMEKNMKYMMHSMKPMLITFIPIIFVFGWLRTYYTGLGNPVVLSIGTVNLTWIWAYILFSIVTSLILRKLMKVH